LIGVCSSSFVDKNWSFISSVAHDRDEVMAACQRQYAKWPPPRSDQAVVWLDQIRCCPHKPGFSATRCDRAPGNRTTPSTAEYRVVARAAGPRRPVWPTTIALRQFDRSTGMFSRPASRLSNAPRKPALAFSEPRER